MSTSTIEARTIRDLPRLDDLAVDEADDLHPGHDRNILWITPQDAPG